MPKIHKDSKHTTKGGKIFITYMSDKGLISVQHKHLNNPDGFVK